jgi:hypothetical protein
VLELQTAGTTAVTVDASQNVGIGTATPGYKLDVQSSASSGAPLLANFQAAGGDVQVYIQNGTVKTQINADATNSASIIGSFSNHPLSLRTNNTERMRIDSSGYVGIGTTSLDILDQAGASRPLVVKRSDSSTAINSSTASIAIVNGDTTTSNTAQLNFAAITGANTSGYSSAVISCIFGARTNGQYPTGILTFSTSTLLNAAPTEKMRIDSSGNLLFNSGYGSVATAYGCRAWVNFNGTGTPAIRGSGNVSSITDNGTGDYTINFTTAMPDANYSTVGTTGSPSVAHGIFMFVKGTGTATTASNVRISTVTTGSADYDFVNVLAAIFR